MRGRSKSAVAEQLVEAADALRRGLAGLRFGLPVTHVYNPLIYAWEAHLEDLRRFANNRKRVLFLGMNPGPFGMVQTGIPFGEARAVRDWMRIRHTAGRPANPQPEWLVGIRRFAEDCAARVFQAGEVKLACIPHPSPASPAANRDWVGRVTAQLESLEIWDAAQRPK
jgi:hypothetical protein